MKRFGLLFAALILIGAALLQIAPRDGVAGEAKSQLALLPSAGPSWTATDIPLGNTEVAAGNVADILRYDDVVNRQYLSAGGETFSIYAAYWRPGKMPVQLVASHTPDRCWSSAGWECTSQTSGYVVAPSPPISPGEGRLFVHPRSSRQHVVFWHLVGRELYDYGERFNAVPSPWKWWRDAARQIFRTPEEQYFIRLSSPEPFEKLVDDPGFQAVLSALGKLGLAAR